MNFIFDEDQLDSLGYQMMKEKKIGYAIELFKVNIEEYPDSAAAYKSLGDAYQEAGEIALAIENYKKSLSLNPDNDETRQVLKKLEKNR